MIKNRSSRVAWALSLAAAMAAWAHPLGAKGATPVIATGLSSFGLEEPTVLYHPSTNTFTTGDTYPNIIDEGGGMIRATLRNYQDQDWWDGDRNNTDNSPGSGDVNRQRAEVKNLGGTSYRQLTDETYEYSFDFRSNPEFMGTGHFCHIFQLKATDETGVGSSGSPLVTLSLYKSGSVTQGRLQYTSGSGSGQARTFSFTPGQWYHAVIRITTTSDTGNNGVIMASINGDAFQGVSGLPVYRPGATTYYNKWGFYRGIGLDYGVPLGDSWIEDRTETLLKGTTSILVWKGGLSANAWDVDVTQNWLNGAAADSFSTADQVNFNDSTANNTVNLTAAVSPNYTVVDAAQNYTFSGAGKISGGTLVKKNTGTLTLATTNDYPGLTQVQDGTLLVSGSIGNNSLVYITGGTLRAGSSAALGTNSGIGTVISGGTLDINGQSLSSEPITVQGTGVGGTGAIVNSNVQQINALTSVTLSGDATFGGTSTPPGGSGFGRWDIRGSGATLSTTGHAYNLTKVGVNQVSLVGTSVDAALGNININQGILGFQTSTSGMGDASKTVTIASGAVLEFYNTTNAMSKQCVLNGGTIWAESGTGVTQNTFAGPITVTSLGGTFDAGGSLTGGTPKPDAVLHLTGPISGVGGVTKTGPSTVFITGLPSYYGGTTINEGTLQINSGTEATLHAISGGGTLGVDNSTALTVDSITIGSLTIGAGSKVTVAMSTGGALAGAASLSAVPEPATWAMLMLAAMGLGLYRRRSR